MELVVSVNRQVLHGEQGAKARAAAAAYFEAESVTPEQAARAAWEMEGALEFNQRYDVGDEAVRRAEVWVRAPEVVATVLGLSADDVDVELSPGS